MIFRMKFKYFENCTIHLRRTNTTNDNRCTVNCLSQLRIQTVIYFFF